MPVREFKVKVEELELDTNVNKDPIWSLSRNRFRIAMKLIAILCLGISLYLSFSAVEILDELHRTQEMSFYNSLMLDDLKTLLLVKGEAIDANRYSPQETRFSETIRRIWDLRGASSAYQANARIATHLSSFLLMAGTLFLAISTLLEEVK